MVRRWVVLLRAVNVGGRTLAMAKMEAALLAAGCSEVTTVGAAGSAVVTAAGAAEGLRDALTTAIAKAAGFEVDVLVRTDQEWTEVVGGNPFPQEASDDPGHLVVTVLSAAPAVGAWAELNGAIVGRERVVPGGRHAYVVYPDGIGRSKLTPALIERKLGVRGTSRNWNTVVKLQELVRGSP
ncbi:MAG TPA: DUF1697 domain-containing protein [Thermoplasmata archaeon]|nr:DUF1697 domain-containing protein [Thermoplasmata archaeon]